MALFRRILTPTRRIHDRAGEGLARPVDLTRQHTTAMLTIIFLSAALMLIPAFLPGERRLQNTNMNLNSNH